MLDKLRQAITKLENAEKEETEIIAETFAIAASSLHEQKEMISSMVEAENNTPVLAPVKLTKKELLKRYGSYQNTYEAYKTKYGISCKKGWANLLPLIEGLEPPSITPSLEERVAILESLVYKLIEKLDIKL